jgi:hypothetical protein
MVFVASNKLANCDKEPNSITSLKPDVAASNSTGRETLERPTRLVQVVIVCDIQPVLHPTTKSFEPSLEGLCCFMYLHVGFERLSLNSDSRQRSPRQMTTDCCVSLKGANVYGALCRNGLICLACFQRYPLLLLQLYCIYGGTGSTRLLPALSLHAEIFRDAMRDVFGIFFVAFITGTPLCHFALSFC